MNSIKNVGKIKEQLQLENAARRNYPKKWLNPHIQQIWNRMYNQNELDQQLKQLNMKDLCPYQYTGEGDSYFVSRDMYQLLVAQCRCGRSRCDLHLLKCLQKAADITATDMQQQRNENQLEDIIKIPKTSNGVIGWPVSVPAYKKWENSMKYVSPLHTMPGPRINDKPYNVIMIG